jgi:RNA 2',3'-cyclic 3'-phosphodiesterase
VPPADVAAAIPALERAVEREAAFEATLARFGSFPHREPTLFLQPEPVDAFRRLHAALRSAYPDLDDLDRFSGGFTPHLSVGQCPSSRELPGLLASLSAAFAPVRTRCDSLAILHRTPETHDVMIEVGRVPLPR